MSIGILKSLSGYFASFSLVLMLNLSCASIKTSDEVLIDQKLERCMSYRHAGMLDMLLIDSNNYFQNREIAENIYQYWENQLLFTGALNGINKESYSQLFIEILEPGILDSSFKNFHKELSFDPYYLFSEVKAYGLTIGCIDYLHTYLNTINDDDWRLKYIEKISLLEQYGFPYLDEPESNKYILELIDLIPPASFNNVLYRRQLLFFIYKTAYYQNDKK